ncbi:MAG: MotA/TolQ/ExbB proton channel family protein [Deltaproteobacteria bacterium]|nr:MotA/TolQ/ExbB proton channel family protein [Deltaproteobacteria bacterium]
MEFNLVETWLNMNNLVRAVVIVLTVQAIACITVFFDRSILLLSSYRKSRKFAKAAGPKLTSRDYPGALEIAKTHSGSHLANFIVTGVETYLDKYAKGYHESKAAEFANRALERKSEQLSTELHRGMNILASTGSTAPFIGLLGTVLGILNAFRLVGETGSGGMGTIGVAIAEALIVTGYGLMVAIPSVLIFNWLSGRIASYETGIANAGSALVDQLEDSSSGSESLASECSEQNESRGGQKPASAVN